MLLVGVVETTEPLRSLRRSSAILFGTWELLEVVLGETLLLEDLLLVWLRVDIADEFEKLQ